MYGVILIWKAKNVNRNKYLIQENTNPGEGEGVMDRRLGTQTLSTLFVYF